MSLIGKKKGRLSIPTEDPDTISQYYHTTPDTDHHNVNISLKNDAKKASSKESLTFKEWICKHPFRKGKFMVFVVGFVLSIIVGCLYVSKLDEQKAYIILAVIGLVMCGVGISNFRTLMKLIQHIDFYSRLNIKFGSENMELKIEAEKVTKEVNNLKEQKDRIAKNILNQKKNMNNLKYLNNKMNELGISNVDKLRETLQKAKLIKNKWKEKLIQTDRGLILEVFSNIIDKCSDTGMTEEIYEKEFIKRLPARYVIRLYNCGTFTYISGGQKVINLGDFALFLDELADMVSHNERTKQFNIAFAKKRSQFRLHDINNESRNHQRRFTCIKLTKHQLSMDELRKYKNNAYYNSNIGNDSNNAIN